MPREILVVCSVLYRFGWLHLYDSKLLHFMPNLVSFDNALSVERHPVEYFHFLTLFANENLVTSSGNSGSDVHVVQESCIIL